MAEVAAASAQASMASCSSSDEPVANDVPRWQISDTTEALATTLTPQRPEGRARNGRRICRHRFLSEISDTTEALPTTFTPQRPEGRARNGRRISRHGFISESASSTSSRADRHIFSSEPTRSASSDQHNGRLQETMQSSKTSTRLRRTAMKARVDEHKCPASQELTCMENVELFDEDVNSASDQISDTEDEDE